VAPENMRRVIQLEIPREGAVECQEPKCCKGKYEPKL